MDKNNKKLTIELLKQKSEELNEVGTLTILLDEQECDLEYDLHFRKTKMNKVIQDVVDLFSFGAENVDVLEFVTPYTSLLIAKHFTSLEVPDDIVESLVLLHELIDLDVLEQIIVKLPEDEVVKMYEKLTEAVGRMSQTLTKLEDEQNGE